MLIKKTKISEGIIKFIQKNMFLVTKILKITEKYILREQEQEREQRERFEFFSNSSQKFSIDYFGGHFISPTRIISAGGNYSALYGYDKIRYCRNSKISK